MTSAPDLRPTASLISEPRGQAVKSGRRLMLACALAWAAYVAYLIWSAASASCDQDPENRACGMVLSLVLIAALPAAACALLWLVSALMLRAGARSAHAVAVAGSLLTLVPSGLLALMIFLFSDSVLLPMSEIAVIQGLGLAGTCVVLRGAFRRSA
ncbi:hypothetical protein [Kitasatospora viridis]|uniref:hypothetical protein n=1 Tax=Kitasatospora viridis TaxID=281105 RepID=UPI0011A6961D|nr:hypothetical protein [Kitasatospora viridis]